MREAIKEAKKALKLKEIPVGCVIVKDDKIIARAYNQKEKKKNATAHAEILAINKAEKKLGDWRLNGATMYVTLEPCMMCEGAILSARLDKVVFGAVDENFGALSSKAFHNKGILNHNHEYQSGVMEQECKTLLKEFFNSVRK